MTLRDIFSSTLAFPVGTIQQTDLRWMCQYAAGISLPGHQDGDTSYNPFPTDVYYLGNLVREDYMEVRNFICSDKAAS
jgi:hypothetical protein